MGKTCKPGKQLGFFSRFWSLGLTVSSVLALRLQVPQILMLVGALSLGAQTMGFGTRRTRVQIQFLLFTKDMTSGLVSWVSLNCQVSTVISCAEWCLFWMWTLFAGQEVNPVVSGSGEIRGHLGKGLEAVVCYQPCRHILVVWCFNWVLSETKPSKEGTSL